eukprot:4984791-Lingulodinium_polyedra.AAC.1
MSSPPHGATRRLRRTISAENDAGSAALGLVTQRVVYKRHRPWLSRSYAEDLGFQSLGQNLQ